MSQLKQDIRYAMRQLRRSPGFTAMAIITLALGIGDNTAAFTLMYGILLRWLTVADPGRLYRIGDGTSQCCEASGSLVSGGDFEMFSADLYLHLKQTAPEFEQLAAVGAEHPHFSVRRGSAATQFLTGSYV